MTNLVSSADIERFQHAIAHRLGLRFDDGKQAFLEELLSRRSAVKRSSPAEYVAALAEGQELTAEVSALALELTVGETYFFRHREQFEALLEVALPERMVARAATRELQLLSAGCASGEEAYSLAMLARDRGIEPGFKVRIQGLDLNSESLAKAQRARYSAWSLRETPDPMKARWFVEEGREYRLAAELREAVRFDQHNLIEPHPLLFAPGSYDVVFCRNVLMYFTPEHTARIVAQLTRALVPGGYLFLGHAETLRGLSQDFHLRHTHGTFYYQRKEPTERADTADTCLRSSGPGVAGASPNTSASIDGLGDWLSFVEQSSDRVRQLARGETASRAPITVQPAPPASRGSGALDLRLPLQLLREERFGDALTELQRVAGESSADPAAALLRAALLTHQGDLLEAERACRQLLSVDESNAGAHYLLALCCERRGEVSAAADHDQTAVYLDAGFAMPHLHLGLMARRKRELATARRELSQALLLLEGEDSSRVAMFGGGFGRDALLALCRSQLESLKGTP